ncbi:MAG: erythrose-4-phosphate dehydrogenase [Desulfococcus sp. 4484_241]|nr:MAG: erythrose-4-phosphate dehydrogenase [Desulfococcus sp. 4484_241]
MPFRIAINGYGRIGRCILRALYESARNSDISIVAINDVSNIEAMAHLTMFDSTHGRFAGEVKWEKDLLCINGDPIRVSFEKEIKDLPWRELDIDAVLECTGTFTDRDTAEGHLESGTGSVVFSCPAEGVDATIVYGINHTTLKKEHTVISNASCTSNCIVPVIHTLDRELGIIHGITTTIHSIMNDQPVIDAYHNRDLRKSRSSSRSVIPVDTKLQEGIGRILPHMKDRFQAIALRVPITNVSAMQLTVQVTSPTTVEKVNDIFKKAAAGPLAGILGYTEMPLVSCDFNHDPRSAVIDGTQTRVSGKTGVSVLAWFDNEWGFANRMLDTTMALLTCKNQYPV